MTLQAHSAIVAFGANLGNPARAIQQAMQLLSQHPNVSEFKASNLYRTKPVDAIGPDFCNAVAQLKTSLNAPELLALLLDIEQRLGRERSTRNAPRTIDLDLIALDQQTMTLPDLTLPHPRAHTRAFVLIPLCEIAQSVVLGPQDMSAQQPASDWLSQLTPTQRQEVAPW